MEYNSEQLNYFRICYIAFNLVPEGLRTVFKQEWNFLYETTSVGEWKDIPQNGNAFYQKETRKSRKKNARYLATIKDGNTAEWDCSCLFFAVLFSDSIGTTLSPAIKKDVDDLRQVRNDIAHKNEAELTNVEFQNYVATVLAAFNSLKLPVNEIEAVKNQTSFPTPELNSLKMQTDKLKAYLQTKEEEVKTLTEEINSKVESFCTLTFQPSHEIIRRSNDVTRIMTKLEELNKGSNGAVSMIYLSGNPGCGKSQIARQLGEEIFDRRSRESKRPTFVATLNAETLDSLVDSYTSLARNLGITEYALTNLATLQVSGPKEMNQHLKRLILPKIKLFSDWLMIADNVVDLSLVGSYLLPTANEKWGHGQVLITTQDSSSIPSNAPHTYHESLSKGMQPDDAVELLRQVSQISNQDQAERVAEVLEYQPLALAAAAFYVQTVVSNGSPNYNWKNYLETFSRGECEATEELLATQNIAYSKTMTMAIKMAITRTLESDEVLRQAFCLFSLCAFESLPIEAAVKFVKECHTSGQTEELIKAKILRSSLITCLCGEDGKPVYVRVHNIVHEVLKSVFTSYFELRKRVQYTSAAIEIFRSSMMRDRNLLSASEHVCEKLRKITTHCKVLHEVLSSNIDVTELVVNESLDLVTPGKLVSWLTLAADICCDLSKPSEANLFSTSAACKFVNYLGDKTSDKLLKADAFSEHGKVLNLQCEYKTSLSFYDQARAIYKDIDGEKSDKAALLNNRLGNVNIGLGQYTQAKGYHKKALSISKKIHGKHHANVAANYRSLGSIYNELGKHGKAKGYFKKALSITYDEHCSDDVVSCDNLELDYSDLRQNRQAKEPKLKKKIDAAGSHSNLGAVYHDLGKHSEAKEHLDKALSIRKEIYGEYHADVAASYDNLAIVYRALGQHSQAIERHKKALSIRETIYGEYHGDVAGSYFNLAIAYNDQEMHSEAKNNFEKALSIAETIYGEYHADVAGSYHYLGRVCRDLQEHGQAEEYFNKALSIRSRICGEEHPLVANTYYNLGLTYSDLKKYDLAKECLEKALNIYKRVYRKRYGLHIDVKETSRNLKIVKREQKRIQAINRRCCFM